MLNFCRDHLILPAPELRPPSLLPLHAEIWQQLEMAVSLQQRFKKISPSFQYHHLKLQIQNPDGSELPSDLLLPPQDHPAKIAKLQQRFPPKEAELK